MPIPRVGREIEASEYWKEVGDSYKSNMAGPYHSHRMAMVRRLINDLNFGSKVCLDFGCGEGILLEELARQGGRMIGLDPSDQMLASARERLSEAHLEAKLSPGGVEALKEVRDSSVDFLFAINVIAYFTDEEATTFYCESHRILEEGGSLVVTHSNELFDLYTLNAFTVEFFEKNFCGPGTAAQIASLLSSPNTSKPTRKVSFNIRENPLSYRHALAAYGFEEVQQEFANFHPFPPLLMEPEGFIDIDKREYADTLDWDEKDRWKLIFMCSMFGSRSIVRKR